MVKVDVTKGGNPFYERLLQEYGVKGVPTIVFLDGAGKGDADFRLVDYLPPDQFLGRMAQLKKPASLRKEKRMLKVRFFLNEPNGKP